jgi:hypothetical protein
MYDDREEFTMTEALTVDLPADVARRARAVATATNRRVEEVVVEWLGRAVADTPMEELPDAEVLELARGQMTDQDQATLSDLLERQAELMQAERVQLDGVLATYRRGLELKARALKEAVVRGLMPGLGDHGA